MNSIFPKILLISFLLSSQLSFAADIKLNVLLSLTNIQCPDYIPQFYQEGDRHLMVYEDNLLKIVWELPQSLKGILFALKNKTDHTMRIIWDGVTFVDERGINYRVIHQGVKYSEKNNAQPPTVLMKQTMLQDIIIPSDNICWEDGYGRISGNWEIKPLFRVLDGYILGNDYLPGYRESVQDIKKKLAFYEGKSFQILLPFQILGKVKEYNFTFKVENADITSTTVDLDRHQKILIRQWVLLDYFLWVKLGKTTKKELILKYGTPYEQDEDIFLYKRTQANDFSEWEFLKFKFDNVGVVNQIWGQK